MKFRYFDGNSPLHLISPLSKLAWVSVLLILTFIFDQPLVLLVLFLATLLPVFFAGTFKAWASIMKYSIYLCLSIIVINALFSGNGTHVLWKMPWTIPVLGTSQITLEAVIFGLGMSLRLLALISAFALLTLTTHPDDILQSLLQLKVPYKSVLVVALSTRFVPTLAEDAGRIRDLQRSRGLETERGNIFRRLKNNSQVLLPLLSNSLDRTVQLAEAMESRGFGSGNKRSFYKVLKLTRPDIFSIIFSLLAILPAVMLRWREAGAYQYYPSLGAINFSPAGYITLGLVFLLIGLIVPMGKLKKGAGI